MKFSDYVLNEESKVDELTNVALVNADTDTDNILTYLNHLDPNILSGRILLDKKYAIYKKKYINLTELANEIRALYLANGYMGQGFSRLSDVELLKYSVTKTLLKKIFDNDLYNNEIDTKKCAIYFFKNEFIYF